MWRVWGEERRIHGFGGDLWGKETTWETQAKLSLRSEYSFFLHMVSPPQIRPDQSVPLLVSVGPTDADIKTERKRRQSSEDRHIQTV